MPIRVNDLKDALDKLNEPQVALEKMDQLNGKWLGERLGSVANDVTARSNLINQGIFTIADSIAEQQAQLAAGMVAALAPATNLPAQLKTAMASRDVPALALSTIAFKAAMASITDSGLGKMFEDLERRKREALAYYRPLAYALIKSEHLEHAIARIDWEAFMAAQRPSLTEQEEAAGDSKRAPVIAERSQLAATLDSRLREREIQERAATELLAYAWGYGRWEDAAIADMFIDYLPDSSSWGVLSTQRLEPDYLRKILDAPKHLPATAGPFRDGYARFSAVGLMQGILPLLMKPMEGDRRYWPVSEVYEWDNGKGRFQLSFYEPPGGYTPAAREAAWELARGLNQWMFFTAVTLAAMYHQNKRHGGRLVFTTNDILKFWGKGGRAGFRKGDKANFNAAMYTLSQAVVQDLEYRHKPQGKKKREERRLPTAHFLDKVNELGGENGNITWDIGIGMPLLQMAADFPLQLAHIAEGSISPNAREPYRALLETMLPLRASAYRDTFTKHGLPIRTLLLWAGIDVDAITRQDRPYWKKYVPELLTSIKNLERWEWKSRPSVKWDRFVEDRVLLFVKRDRPQDETPEEELEAEEGTREETPPGPQRISQGWLTGTKG